MPKNVMCKNCNNLKNDWCKMVDDSPDPDLRRDCQYFWERTNADRIRAMSDEELVEFIGHNLLCDKIRNVERKWCEAQDVCDNCLLEWLKQPAEGENNAED